MTITARYAATCTACQQPVTPGQQIEWTKGSREVHHADCGAATASQPAAPSASHDTVSPDRQPIGAKATYRGRTVYVVARVRRSGWGPSEVSGLVKTRDGAKALVLTGGGRRAEWVPTSELALAQTYQRAWSFASMRRTREREANGEGCYMCGRLSCEGARGGLCQED